MKEISKYLIIGLSVIISVVVLASAITFYGKSKETISVTGLGETVFLSDKIVWEGCIVVEATDKQNGYSQIEKDQQVVENYLKQNGVTDEEITFLFVNSDKTYTSLYNNEGNYVGSRFSGYRITQRFIITSNDVDRVERISRRISSLVAQNIDIESYSPEYYYTHLDDLKLQLIEKASRDARLRAEHIATNAGAKLGKATSARLGVFQITSANGEEEYSYGGAFNITSKEKKARITVKMEYKLK